MKSLLAIVTGFCFLLGYLVLASTSELFAMFTPLILPLTLSWGMLGLLRSLGISRGVAVLVGFLTGAIGSPLLLGLIVYSWNLYSSHTEGLFSFSPVEGAALATCISAIFSIPVSVAVVAYYQISLLEGTTSQRRVKYLATKIK